MRTPLAVRLAAPCLLAASSIAFAQDPTTRVVALDGDKATGTKASETVEPLGDRDLISIDWSGRVLFDARTAGATPTREGWFVATGRSAKAVALFDDAIPTAGVNPQTGFNLANYKFADLDRVHLGSNGDLLMEVDVTDGNFVLPALVTEIGGTRRVSAIEFNATIPGLACPLEKLGNGIFSGDVNLHGGHLIVPGRLCAQDTESVFIRQGGGNASAIAVVDGAVPGASGSMFDSLFRAVNVHASGAASFRGRYFQGGT